MYGTTNITWFLNSGCSLGARRHTSSLVATAIATSTVNSQQHRQSYHARAAWALLIDCSGMHPIKKRAARMELAYCKPTLWGITLSSRFTRLSPSQRTSLEGKRVIVANETTLFHPCLTSHIKHQLPHLPYRPKCLFILHLHLRLAFPNMPCLSPSLMTSFALHPTTPLLFLLLVFILLLPSSANPNQISNRTPLIAPLPTPHISANQQDNVSSSAVDPSIQISGVTTSAVAAHYVVAIVITVSTLLTLLAAFMYARNDNPYAPFVTAVSLSDDSFDSEEARIIRQQRTRSGRLTRAASIGFLRPRRYQARSLEFPARQPTPLPTPRPDSPAAISAKPRTQLTDRDFLMFESHHNQHNTE